MALVLFNSYTKRKERFHILRDKQVTMYNCGPTVYDYAHIGNLRSFLFSDVLRRYLEYRGCRVRQVMNITDVGHMVGDADAGEDKMALAVRREGKGPKEVARFYEQKFFEDMSALGVRRAWKYPRASEHVPEMVKMVKKLIKKGHAYLVPEYREIRSPLQRRSDLRISKGASVYYDLSTFPRYGKLSGNRVEDLIPGARAEVVHEKRQPYDFALWIYKPGHVLQWESPWGAGYPGWHLECSAMAMKYLGPTIDIHTGGEDNKFPHHECEIAQSEGATGQQFARVWMHVKHLLVDGKKMSKSAGNFYTLRDLVNIWRSDLRRDGDRISPYRVIRYALISAHYRETLNFTFEGLKSAQAALERVDELVDKVKETRKQGNKETELQKVVEKARRDFIAAMDDDLNVPEALSALFRFVRKMNEILGRLDLRSYGDPISVYREARQLLNEFDAVLGLGIGTWKKATVPAAVMKLVKEREAARREKNWARADAFRVQIRAKGFVVEDTSDGPRLKATVSS